MFASSLQTMLFRRLLSFIFFLPAVVRCQQIRVVSSTNTFSLCGALQTAGIPRDRGGLLTPGCFPGGFNSFVQSPVDAVYVSQGCVMNSTGTPSCVSGLSSVSQDPTLITLPVPVVDAFMEFMSLQLTVLFPNFTTGSILCDGTCPMGPLNLTQPVVISAPEQGMIVRGTQPPPLRLMEGGVGVELLAVRWSWKDSSLACFVLTNATITCATNCAASLDDAFTAFVAIVEQVPEPDSRTVLQLCLGYSRQGTAHACILYDDGQVTCWGSAESCLNGRCSPPPAVLFSSIDCGDVVTCGITHEGAIRCFGSPLSSTVMLSTPSGVFGQISLPDGFPCAVSATDASVQCFAVPQSLTNPITFLLPNFAVQRVSIPCALRRDPDLTLTPSIGCWTLGEDSIGATGSEGYLHLPPDLTHTPFRSIAVGALFICVQHVNRSVGCWADPDLSSFMVLPPDLGTDVAQIQLLGDVGVLAWMQSGMLILLGRPSYSTATGRAQ